MKYLKSFIAVSLTTVFLLASQSALADDLQQDHKSFNLNTTNSSLVKEFDSYVIIDGNTHEELWNAPFVATKPGNPIRFFLSINVADRIGKDLSFDKQYYTSTDFFQNMTKVDQLPPEISFYWNKTLQSDIPDFPILINHLWSSPPVYLDKSHVIQAFTQKSEQGKYSVTTALCKISDGKLIALKLGNFHTIEKNSPRGLYEPYIAKWNNKFYMTCRAEDKHGYLLVSDDGLNWGDPIPWTWDIGEEIPMDQTMTKFVVHSDGLLLCYTRIRDDNAETFRHRAPLHIADFDPATLRLKKDSEYIIVPNKGMPVGNFWVWPVNQQESCVVTAEWPRDKQRAEQNINGDIWLCRIKWQNPNTLLTKDGRDVASTKIPSITKPGMLFSFDDRNMLNWEKQIPLFQKYGAHVTFFVDRFDTLTPEQIEALKSLQKAGHAIGCHGLRHKKAIDYYKQFGIQAFLSQEIDPAIQIMNEHGFEPTSYAYPNSKNDEMTDSALLKVFRHLRSGSHGSNKPLAENDDIFVKIEDVAEAGTLYGGSCHPHSIDDDIVKQTIAAMERAKRNGEIFTLYAHDIRQPTTEKTGNYIAIEPLEMILAHAQKIGLEFYTFDDLP